MVDFHAYAALCMRLFRRGRIAGDLWLPGWAVDMMVAEAEQWASDETGGAFMGYATEDGVVVTDLIGPGPKAVRTPTEFVPDAEYQLNEISRLYQQSGRLQTYIGDWHSHPNGSPAYSRVDHGALREIARSPEGRCGRPLMVILGSKDTWAMIAWRYQSGRWWDTIAPLRIRHF